MNFRIFLSIILSFNYCPNMKKMNMIALIESITSKGKNIANLWKFKILLRRINSET